MLLTDTNAIYFSWVTNDSLSNTYDARIYYSGFTKPVSFSDDMGNAWGASGDTVDFRPTFYWAENPDTAIMITITNWSDTTYDTVLADSYWIDTISVPDSFVVQVTADLNYSGEYVGGGVLHFNAKLEGPALPYAGGYAKIEGYIYREGHPTDTAKVPLHGALLRASRITDNHAWDTTGTASSFVYHEDVEVWTDTLGKYKFYLKRTFKYADTTEGFYNIVATYGGAELFNVRSVHIPSTGNIDLGFIAARRE